MSEIQKSAEIITPFGDYCTPADTAEIVEILEEWLGKARRGEITALAICGMMPNDHSLTNWRSGPHSMITILGLISVLKDDVLEGVRAK